MRADPSSGTGSRPARHGSAPGSRRPLRALWSARTLLRFPSLVASVFGTEQPGTVQGGRDVALPPPVRRRVERRIGRYCRERFPAHLRGELRLEYSVQGDAVILMEVRPHDRGPERWTRSAVARLRYDSEAEEWSLFWQDRRGRWQDYSQLGPTSDLEAVLVEITGDPTGVFWG